MKKWFRNISEISKTRLLFQTSHLIPYYPDYDQSAIRLSDYLKRKSNIVLEEDFLNSFFSKTADQPIYLYENNDFEENFILIDHRLYVRHFFFQTLTVQVQAEFDSFVFFQLLYDDWVNTQDDQSGMDDFLIDLGNRLPDFLSYRKNQLSEEEYQELYLCLKDSEKEALLGLVFISLIYYNHYDKFNAFEKKNLKEIVFPKKVKKILNLQQDDYDYLQKIKKLELLPEKDQFRYQQILADVEKENIQLIDYVENFLKDKKILFWCMWAVSPFLVWDINRLFGMIHQFKKVIKVHLDLPVASQEVLERWFRQPTIEEALVEEEIKKIYPEIIDDYAKESLPYLKLLERLHYFQIPVNCFGIEGEKMISLLPYLKEEKLIFEDDPFWIKSVTEEYRRLDDMKADELVIFFYFLKPIYPFKSAWMNRSDVEALIHTDPFTGFGPKKFENSLSLYSQYKPKSHSFVFTSLKESIFRDEPIIFYPYGENHFFKLDEDSFNRFRLFDTLLYSTTQGGGGGAENFSPLVPGRKKIFS